VCQVRDHNVGFAADALDLFGDLLELGLRTGRNDNVSTGFRERQRHRRSEPAARAGHYRYLVIKPKSVKNHVRFPSVAGANLSNPRQ
jgi:hypothetical protein